MLGVIYRPLGAMRFVLVGMFAIFAALAVVMIVSAAVGGSGLPVAFVLFWSAAVVWNGYWWLWRTCVSMEVKAETRSLRWAATLRRGVLSVDDLHRVRPSKLGRQLAVFELHDRRSLIVPVRYGFERLVQMIKDSAPAVAFDD